MAKKERVAAQRAQREMQALAADHLVAVSPPLSLGATASVGADSLIINPYFRKSVKKLIIDCKKIRRSVIQLV